MVIALRTLGGDSAESRWLWKGYIPEGGLTIVEGDPGTNKSTLTLQLAADVTRGTRQLLDIAIEPGDVWLMGTEDDQAVIAARLRAAGANLARVKLPNIEGDGQILLPRDFDKFAAEMRRSPPRLIIIDPLSACLEQTMTEAGVRRALQPLVKLAQQHSIAVIGIRHFTKSGSGNSLYRGLGSIGMTAVARSVLQVAKHPKNPQQRILASAKSSYSSPPPSLLLRVEPKGDVAILSKIGPCEFTADDFSNLRNGSVLQEAKDFLVSLLGEGALLVEEVHRLAGESGFKARTIRRAKDDLEVVYHRRGFGRGSVVYWQLPNSSDAVQAVRDKQFDTLFDQLVTGDADFRPAPAEDVSAKRRT